jgi:hypothetical protein
MLGFLRKSETSDVDYYGLLPRIHALLKPSAYVEIGVRNGESLLLARSATTAVGIDPAPQITAALPPSTRIFRMTSDNFFANHDLKKELGGKPLDLAFIDGMHLFEFALRDFINLEKAASPGSTILVHDCYPVDRITAQRDRTTRIWSGDVWKLVLCLKKYRPDLQVATIDVPPTGLGVIRKLDPASNLLASRLQSICEEFIPYEYGEIETNKPERLNSVENRWHEIKALLAA